MTLAEFKTFLPPSLSVVPIPRNHPDSRSNRPESRIPTDDWIAFSSILLVACFHPDDKTSEVS